MFYKLDKRELKYVKVNWLSTAIKGLTGFILLLFILGWSYKPNVKENYTEDEVMVIMSKYNQFSKDKLVDMIKSLNFKFPYVVMGQSLLETGYYKSPVFMENHNLFGMKEATKRINKALGTQNMHAYYKDWVASVDDYALYCATYLSKIDNEDDYITYLSQRYAEDPKYAEKLKDIIVKENLKSLFQ
jgi:hypothetical protein